MRPRIPQPLHVFFGGSRTDDDLSRQAEPDRMSLKQLKGKQVVITGATDGIGRDLARLLTAQGAKVLIVGRRPAQEVQACLLAGQSYLQADLTDSRTPAVLVSALAERGWDDLDMLIHNAAAGWVGDTELQPLESLDAVLATNLIAPCALSHALLPYLRPAHGRIVFIGSVVSDKTCPSYAVYGATKAALQGFARSLKLELSGKVEIQVIHPGPTRTGFHRKSGLELDATRRNRLLSRFFLDPREVAAAILRSILQKPAVATAGHLACIRERFHSSRSWACGLL